MPEYAWGKMIRALAKGPRELHALQELGTIRKKLWNDLTRMLKEMSFYGQAKANDEDMILSWHQYNDLVRAVMGLIDKTRI